MYVFKANHLKFVLIQNAVNCQLFAPLSTSPPPLTHTVVGVVVAVFLLLYYFARTQDSEQVRFDRGGGGRGEEGRG